MLACKNASDSKMLATEAQCTVRHVLACENASDSKMLATAYLTMSCLFSFRRKSELKEILGMYGHTSHH